MIISIKQFTETDSKLFSEFSGDFNPIHLDPLYASRTPYEVPIVHGTQVLLYSLELLVSKTRKPIKSFYVTFHSAIKWNETLIFDWNAENNTINVTDFNSKVLVILKKIVFAENFIQKDDYNFFESPIKLSEPEESDIDTLTIGTRIFFTFQGNNNLCHEIYPELCKVHGLMTICEIAKLSAFSGMKIPGRYSLLRNLNVEVIDFQKSPNYFQIERIDYRVGALNVKYVGGTINASVSSFYTPKAIKIPACSEINENLNSELVLLNKTALIIGGSRGLGAWTAKVLSSAGCDVTLTYNKNRSEALNIARDINTYGGKCDFNQLDILSSSSLSSLLKYNYNYVLYFATPTIQKNFKSDFDNLLYNKFKEFYVNAFERLIIQLPKESKVFYPSTLLIEEPELGFREYIRAKLEGEMICSKYADSDSIKIINMRLPRLLTDQNNWIFSKDTLSPLVAAKSILQNLNT